VAVILITHYYAHALPVAAEEPILAQLTIFILSAYVFKLTAALVDTIPFYIGTKYLTQYLQIDAADGGKET
jgi:hypothetical protein